jgi:hypothetical protein
MNQSHPDKMTFLKPELPVGLVITHISKPSREVSGFPSPPPKDVQMSRPLFTTKSPRHKEIQKLGVFVSWWFNPLPYP